MKDISKSVERLLTGHYAPQDVIDVCRAAQQAANPQDKVFTGAVVEKSMHQQGMDAMCLIGLSGVSPGHHSTADAALPVPAAMFSNFRHGDEFEVLVRRKG